MADFVKVAARSCTMNVEDSDSFVSLINYNSGTLLSPSGIFDVPKSRFDKFIAEFFILVSDENTTTIRDHLIV